MAAAGEGSVCVPDLTGKVVKFDGDHFIIDFTRPEPLEATVPVGVSRDRQPYGSAA